MGKLKKLTGQEGKEPTLAEVTSCGLCNRGMRSIEQPQGWRTYRCDCWIGKALGEGRRTDHGHVGEPSTWAKVKTISGRPEKPIDLDDPDYAKGLEWIRKNSPEIYRLMPQSVKDKIRKKVPF